VYENVSRSPNHQCRPRSRPSAENQPPEADLNPLVRAIAWQVYGRLPKPASVELNDLVQAGHVGLLTARSTYNPDSAVPFPRYAAYRVRGEILDMLRQLDTAPRSLRKWMRSAESHARELGGRLQRTPTDEELSETMGLEINELHRKRHAFWSTMQCSLSTRNFEEDDQEYRRFAAGSPIMPDRRQIHRESRELLQKAIGALPDRERSVVTLYYRKELTMKEIGKVLQVNESRISQIHKAAMRSISTSLQSVGVTSAADF
jgi:RNA polymerase sigma factor for flagellar operon FliA